MSVFLEFLMVITRLSPPAQASIALVSLISLWHLFLAPQAGLSVDEAHYALYALKPDWSYFDHPPLVGWLQIPFVWFSQHDWLTRLLPISLFALTQFLLYRLAFAFFPSAPAWLGFWTLVLIQLSLMFQLLGLAMLPEAPLMVFALLTLLTLIKLRQHPKLSTWLWLGLWLGLAALSKYTAITLALSIVLVMLIERRWDWLRTSGPWLAALITLILILPVLYWNMQHDWLSFRYQLEHGTRDPHWSVLRALGSQSAQFILYGPLLYLVGLGLMLTYVWRPSSYRLAALFALPILLLFAYGSGHKLTLPHWTALAWLFIAPVVAHWCLHQWSRFGVRLFAIGQGFFLLVLSLVLNLLLAMPWLVSAPNHPLQDLYGWPQAYEKAQHWQQRIASTSGEVPALFVTNWTHASRLAWYAYPQPVYVTDTRFDQFDLWFGQPTAQTTGLLIVPAYADDLRFGSPGHFARCELLERDNVHIRNTPIIAFSLYLCHGYQPVSHD
jgi:hypothetical protein